MYGVMLFVSCTCSFLAKQGLLRDGSSNSQELTEEQRVEKKRYSIDIAPLIHCCHFTSPHITLYIQIGGVGCM